MWGSGDWCETHHLDHVCYSPNHITPQGHPKTPHFDHHGNSLHHSAPCCVSMCLTSAPARAPSLSGSPRARFTDTSVRAAMAAASRRSTHRKYQAVTAKLGKCQGGSRCRAEILNRITRLFFDSSDRENQFVFTRIFFTCKHQLVTCKAIVSFIHSRSERSWLTVNEEL